MRFLAPFVVALAGCFDVPTPACGFACAASDECPSGYECGPVDNRCHPVGQTDDVCEEAEEPDRDPRPKVSSTTLDDVVLSSLDRIGIAFSAPVRNVTVSTIQLLRDDGEPVGFDELENDGAGFVRLLFPQFTLVEGHAYTLSVGGNIADGDGYRLIPYTETFDVVTTR